MKQTAVEWLVEQITTVKWKMSDITDRNSIIDQAKAMEKEQIRKAYLADAYNSQYGFEQYYKETYESNN